MLSLFEHEGRSLEMKVYMTKPLEAVHFTSIDHCLKYLGRVSRDFKPVESDDFWRFAHGEIIKTFMAGSQIHQNQVILLKLGLPILKLTFFIAVCSTLRI